MSVIKKYSRKITMLIIVVLIIQLAMPIGTVFSQDTGEAVEGAQQTVEGKVANNQNEEEEKNKDPQNENSTFAMLDSTGNDLGNIFTLNLFKLGGRDGTDIGDGAILDIVNGTKVAIEFSWDTIGKDAKAGDWATMQLPDTFKKVSVNNEAIIITQDDGSPLAVGQYSVFDGELKFVFDNNIKDSDVKNGFVGFDLEFNLEKFKENIEQEIKFNDLTDVTINVIARPTGTISGINKSGIPDSQQDAKEITWIIDIINSEVVVITKASVKDIIPAGLDLQEDSFVIHEITVDYYGEKVVGGEITVDPPTPNINGNEFTFSFESISPYKGYQIQYKTTITDYTINTFTNDATLSYADKELPAAATVSGLTRSDAIEKDGKYIGSDKITWEIDVNKSGGNIGEAIIEDILPNGLSIVDNSIKIYKLTKVGDNWRESTNPVGFPITLGGSEDSYAFSVNLGELSENDTYRIKFETNIDYSQINDGVYQENNEFTNKAVLKDGENPRGEAEKTVEFERLSILSKSVRSNVSYNNKTLTWTIKINEARHPLGDVVLTDVLPLGLSLADGDITITSAEGKTYSRDIKITPINEGENNGKTQVVIELDDVGTDLVTIVYTTKITDLTKDSFSNVVSLGGVGIGEGGIQTDETIEPPSNSFAKSNTGNSGINYNDKTMSWRLNINPIREPITSLEIVDTFPNKGMILLPNTLEVKQGSKTLAKGTDYTLVPYTETPTEGEQVTGYHKGFVLTFKGSLPLNTLTTITYKTSFDPQEGVDGCFLEQNLNEQGKYINTAQFIGKTASGDFDASRSADRTVNIPSWNSGKKDGKFISIDQQDNQVNGWVSGNERKIQWELYINYLEQDLGEGVIVTDTLDYEGVIDLDSIVVRKYTLDSSSGDTTITSDVLDKSNYNATLSDNGKTFTLNFVEGFVLDERYVIIFNTSVPDISQARYKNDAYVNVDGTEYPYTSTLDYNKANNLLEKGAQDIGNNVYTGDEIDWVKP